jgi:KDO2-lipid IV(A) lauroyltransferase
LSTPPSPPRRPPLARVLHAVEYAAARAAAALLRLLPIDTAANLMGALWRIGAPLTRRHARALEHLAAAFPDWPPEKREAVARRMWTNLGRVAAEMLMIDRIAADPDRLILTEGIRRATERVHEGAVIVTGHMGNWELPALAADRFGFVAGGVYQTIQNPLIEAWLTRMRAPLYKAGLHVKSAATARHLLMLTKRGGAIGVVSDLRDLSGVEVPFFGRPAFATPFPAFVARVTGKPLIVCRAHRVGDGSRFRLDGLILPVPVTDDRDADVLAATAALHAQFEAWIREAPEQWMWAHRKWVTREDKQRERAARRRLGA